MSFNTPTPPWLALSATGLPLSADPRGVMTLTSGLGLRAIALDAMNPVMRPRNLSRSARRDLSATLRRSELDLAGIDLFLPPEHLTDPMHTQRAIDAIAQSCELSSELAALVGGRSRNLVSITLPESLDAGTREHLSLIAQQWGTMIADHMPVDSTIDSDASLALGLDPATDLIAGGDPIGRAHSVSVLRLSDCNQLGRCPIGAQGSRLKLDEFAAACMIGDHAWVTLDVRWLHHPIDAARDAIDAWDAVSNPFNR